MEYSLLALFGSRRVSYAQQLARPVPFVRMHIHSSNPVTLAVFCNQFLPSNSSNIFLKIARVDK
jgi:hypothetical protein